MSQPSQAQPDVGRFKEALWFELGKVIEEESQRHGKQTTAQFTGAMTEIVWTQLENTARDLETFATHAGRSTINTADVSLITRRNDTLYEIIQDFMAEERAAKELENGDDGEGPRKRLKKSTVNATPRAAGKAPAKSAKKTTPKAVGKTTEKAIGKGTAKGKAVGKGKTKQKAG